MRPYLLVRSVYLSISLAVVATTHLHGSSSLCIQTGSGTHPASYTMGTGTIYLGVKAAGREADHLTPI
jgi:hypothetical protein